MALRNVDIAPQLLKDLDENKAFVSLTTFYLDDLFTVPDYTATPAQFFSNEFMPIDRLKNLGKMADILFLREIGYKGYNVIQAATGYLDHYQISISRNNKYLFLENVKDEIEEFVLDVSNKNNYFVPNDVLKIDITNLSLRTINVSVTYAFTLYEEIKPERLENYLQKIKDLNLAFDQEEKTKKIIHPSRRLI